MNQRREAENAHPIQARTTPSDPEMMGERGWGGGPGVQGEDSGILTVNVRPTFLIGKRVFPRHTTDAAVLHVLGSRMAHASPSHARHHGVLSSPLPWDAWLILLRNVVYHRQFCSYFIPYIN